MSYGKYFRSGQKVTLRALGATPGHYEALTLYLQDYGSGFLNLALPYRTPPEEGYPFQPGMTFELMTDGLGLGLRLNVEFRECPIPGETVRVAVCGELQLFQRRIHRRVDATVGLRYTKGSGTLRSFRAQWNKNVEILRKSDPAKLPPFPESRINLSMGGVRLALSTPVERATLCLLLLQLQKAELPICALGEVVWMADEELDGGRRVAGIQFLNILETDRKRIDAFLSRTAPPPT